MHASFPQTVSYLHYLWICKKNLVHISGCLTTLLLFFFCKSSADLSLSVLRSVDWSCQGNLGEVYEPRLCTLLMTHHLANLNPGPFALSQCIENWAPRIVVWVTVNHTLNVTPFTLTSTSKIPLHHLILILCRQSTTCV